MGPRQGQDSAKQRYLLPQISDSVGLADLVYPSPLLSLSDLMYIAHGIAVILESVYGDEKVLPLIVATSLTNQT